MASRTIKTRVQLKNDTEANWNKAGPKDGQPGFCPLKGELIIYSVDESHPFSRLKVGDGITNVTNLPFVKEENRYLPPAEFIISTNTESSALLTGELNSFNTLTNGKIIYYMTQYACPATNLSIQLKYANSENNTDEIPIYLYGDIRCKIPFPAFYILTLIYYNNAFYLASNNVITEG